MSEMPPKRKVRRRKPKRNTEGENISQRLYADGPERKNPYKYSGITPYIVLAVFVGIVAVCYPYAQNVFLKMQQTKNWSTYQLPHTPIKFNAPGELAIFEGGTFQYWYQEFREPQKYYVLSIGINKEFDVDENPQETISKAVTAAVTQCKGALETDKPGTIRGFQGSEYTATLLRDGRKIIREGHILLVDDYLLDVSCSYHSDHRPGDVVDRFLHSIMIVDNKAPAPPAN